MQPRDQSVGAGELPGHRVSNRGTEQDCTAQEKCLFCPASLWHCAVWCPSGPLPPPAAALRTPPVQKLDNIAVAKKEAPLLPSATPNYPSYISVWALTLSNTSSPMSTHTQTQADAHTHTLSHLPAVLMHCPRTMCTLAKTFKSH